MRESMSFFEPFFGTTPPPAEDGSKVFDWHQAVNLIKEHDIKNASAGLMEDWEYTSGRILNNSVPVANEYTFLFSTWATPILVDEDTQEEYPCWIGNDQTEWGEHTKWPESALKMLKGDV